MSSMFETLLELPLFRGTTQERMSEIVGSCKFDFVKYVAGETIFSKGEACENLCFILSGSVRAALKQEGNPYTVYQTFKDKAVIAPEYMFGMHTVYPMTFVAIDQVSMLKISKSDYIKILKSDAVFMFNALNIVSKLAQKNLDGVVAVTSGGHPAQILAYWAYMVTFDISHDIVYDCPPELLARTMKVGVDEAMRILGELKDDGLIDYSSSEVKIIDRKRLIQKYMCE